MTLTRRSKSRAFTLVELLVVIAIIAVLVAILVPSLSRVRAQAKGTLCLAHLRELSHGWHMYADDNGDVCLPGRYGNLGGGAANPANWYDVGNGKKTRPRWVATMGKYVGIYAFNQPDVANDRQDYDSEVYHCPAVPKWTDERNAAYGYNHQFLGNARQASGEYVNFPVNRSRIRNFAGTVLGADCLGTAAGFAERDRKPYNNNGASFDELGNHGWTLDPPRLTEVSDRGTGDVGSPRTSVDPRHTGRSNVIYCDGHGETLTPERLGYRRNGDGMFLDDRPGNDPPRNDLFSGSGRDDDPPAKPAV